MSDAILDNDRVRIVIHREEEILIIQYVDQPLQPTNHINIHQITDIHQRIGAYSVVIITRQKRMCPNRFKSSEIRTNIQ